MIIYGSGFENAVPDDTIKLLSNQGKLQHLLCSYFYLRKSKFDIHLVADSIIDSGAHSFQKGVHVDWEQYTHDYAKWIRENDTPHIRGYFEMDVDNIIGYENVLKLRRILERESGHADKIIPVWHRNRGIEDYHRMVSEHQIAAVTGFKNEDIQDHQYLSFLKEAWKNDCWLHCLGMTRKKVLDTVPFDSVDSASWKMPTIYGTYKGRKVSREQTTTNRRDLIIACYDDLLRMQRHYAVKWSRMGVHNHPPL